MADSAHSRLALITGITGQDGYYLASRLVNQGYGVVGTSRNLACRGLPRLKELIDNEQILIEELDPVDAKSTRSIIDKYKPDLVFHLSGQSSVGRSFQNPEGTFSSIVNSTYHLLEAVREESMSSRVFIAGSSEIFGFDQSKPVTCSTPTNPQSPYGMAKTAAFNLAREFRKSHGIYVCTGVLFSHESPLRPEQFVTQKIIAGACAIANGEQEKLYLGNLSNKRDWGWAPEYVQAMQKMLMLDKPTDFVIATGQLNQLEAFVAQAFAAVNLDWQKHVVIDKQFFRPNEGSQPSVDVSHTTQHLGWTATTKMSGVIKKMMAAFQNHVYKI